MTFDVETEKNKSRGVDNPPHHDVDMYDDESRYEREKKKYKKIKTSFGGQQRRREDVKE